MTHQMIAANTPGSIRARHADDCMCRMCEAFRRCVVKRAARVAARDAAQFAQWDAEAEESARTILANLREAGETFVTFPETNYVA
jgi:hypothetical protein